MKALIFDSGSLITLSMNCLLSLLKDLKKDFNGKFLITRDVEYEMIEHPINIEKYKLGALRLKNLIAENILEFPESLGVKSEEVNRSTTKYLEISNSVFFKDSQPIHLIDKGEASCLALSSLLSEKGVENVIVIDERTTRMLFEKPENLKKLMEQKLHTKILSREIKNINKIFSFIRSSELIYVAFKKGFVKNKSKEMLDAMLYAARYKGCSISDEEIKEIEKMSLVR